MTITTKVYRFTDQALPWDDWDKVLRQSDGDAFTLERRFLTCIESAIPAGNKIWYVLFYADCGSPIAAACLSSMPVDPTIIASPAIQRAMANLRKVLPSLLLANVVFCGLPVSMGQKSLLFTPRARPAEVLDEMDKLMIGLARQEKARAIVYKEHGEHELGDLQSLRQRGYLQAESLDMYIFEEPFQDFQHYMSNLNAHYRNEVRRSFRKLERAGVEVVRWTDPQSIRRMYTDEYHRLYTAVVARSETRIVVLPIDFFHELTRQFPGQVALTGLVRDGRILAYIWSLSIDSKYQFVYCGIDYSINHQLDLYFNLIYAELDFALQSGASEIRIGQTASRFKNRLGCTQQPLHLFIKGTGFFSRLLLKLFFNLLFPGRETVPPVNIYNSGYKANRGLSHDYS